NLLKGKTIAGRKLVVTKVSGLAQARRCQLVFICSSEAERTAAMLNDLSGMPVLTVGETPRFAEQGGMINLLLVDKNIRFEVNAAAAEKSRIVLHPALVKLGARPEQPSSTETSTSPLSGPG